MKSKILLLAACALTLAFVSCNEGTSKDDEKPAPAQKIKHVECSMSADFYELAEVADITITYPDETGAFKSEVVTTKTWEKKFTTSVFPFKLIPTIVIKAKPGTPAKEKYDLGCRTKIYYTAILANDEKGDLGGEIFTAFAGVSIGYQASALGKFFETFGDKDIVLGGWTLNLNPEGTKIVLE